MIVVMIIKALLKEVLASTDTDLPLRILSVRMIVMMIMKKMRV
jgi:hypothetical protein